MVTVSPAANPCGDWVVTVAVLWFVLLPDVGWVIEVTLFVTVEVAVTVPPAETVSHGGVLGGRPSEARGRAQVVRERFGGGRDDRTRAVEHRIFGDAGDP